MNRQPPQASTPLVGGTRRPHTLLLVLLIAAALAVIGGTTAVRHASPGVTSARSAALQQTIAVKYGLRTWLSGEYSQYGAASRPGDKGPQSLATQQLTRSFEELVSADPESVEARVWFAIFLAEAGRRGEAQQQIEAAKDLDAVTRRERSALNAVSRLYDSSAAFGTEGDIAAIARLKETVDLDVFESLLNKQVHERTGETAKARAISAELGRGAFAWLAKVLVMFGAAAVAILAGIVLGVVHAVVRAGSGYRAARMSPRFPAARLTAIFLVFLALTMGIPALAKFAIGLVTGVEPGEVSTRFIVTWAVCESIVVAAFCAWVASGILAKSGLSLRDIGLKAGPTFKNILRGAGGYLVALPIMIAGAIIGYLIFVKGLDVASPPNPMIDLVAAADDRWVLIGAFLLGSVLAPVIEEIFFRGLLQNIIRAKVGAWGGILGSSAVFAGLHPQLPVGFFPLFGIGCVLAYLYEVSDSLVPSMVAHSLNNTIATVFLLQLIT